MSDNDKATNSQAVWSCKIGYALREHLPSGSDAPMRDAVAKAFKELTGYEDDFMFTGWGGELSEVELAVVEKRIPSHRKCLDDDMAEAMKLYGPKNIFNWLVANGHMTWYDKFEIWYVESKDAAYQGDPLQAEAS